MAFHDIVVDLDPSVTPGAMSVYRTRELPDGSLIEFEEAPAGWLKKDGERRKADWRAYHFTPPAGKRKRYTSVTTLIGEVTPKDGLPPWYEARGIEGAIEAVRRGDLDPHDPAHVADAVQIIRSLRLGGDGARDERADEGIDVHSLLEDWAQTGRLPDPAEHRLEVHGYVTALRASLVTLDPEPIEVEQLVALPRDGYAGRLDLLARVDGKVTLLDYKTQPNCAIYNAAHAQAALYRRAARWCGETRIRRTVIVALAGDGAFRTMDCLADEAMIRRLLAYRQSLTQVTRACEAHNRVEKQARRAAA